MPDRDNAELWERTIGCRRMQGYAPSSRTSRRSAEIPITYQELAKALQICHPIPSIR